MNQKGKKEKKNDQRGKNDEELLVATVESMVEGEEVGKEKGNGRSKKKKKEERKASVLKLRKIQILEEENEFSWKKW